LLRFCSGTQTVLGPDSGGAGIYMTYIRPLAQQTFDRAIQNLIDESTPVCPREAWPSDEQRSDAMRRCPQRLSRQVRVVRLKPLRMNAEPHFSEQAVVGSALLVWTRLRGGLQ